VCTKLSIMTRVPSLTWFYTKHWRTLHTLTVVWEIRDQSSMSEGHNPTLFIQLTASQSATVCPVPQHLHALVTKVMFPHLKML